MCFAMCRNLFPHQCVSPYHQERVLSTGSVSIKTCLLINTSGCLLCHYHCSDGRVSMSNWILTVAFAWDRSQDDASSSHVADTFFVTVVQTLMEMLFKQSHVLKGNIALVQLQEVTSQKGWEPLV